MDFLTYGVIIGGMLFVLFLMWWSYLLGKYYGNYLQSLNKTKEKK